MIIREKGKDIKVVLRELQDSSVKDYYEVRAFNQVGKEMGYVRFSIKDDFVWLWQIVTYEKFQNKGVGQALLDMMEYFCATQTNCNKLQGKFSPENKYAEHFYLKNNYDMFVKNYCFVLKKDLTPKVKSQIIEKVESKLQTPFSSDIKENEPIL